MGKMVKSIRNTFIIGLTMSFFIYPGCHSSMETKKGETVSLPPTPSDASLKSLNALLLKDCREENDSLTRSISKLQQEIRSATARAAEMEIQLTELKAHPASPTVDNKRAAIQPPAMNEARREVDPIPPSIDQNSVYQEGLNLYRQKKFRDALVKFQSAAGDVAGGLADHGIYWSGECHYALKDYARALEAFKKVLEFQQSTKKDDSQMMIGNCYLLLGDRAQAKFAFQKLITGYPASPYVKQAKFKLKKL